MKTTNTGSKSTCKQVRMRAGVILSALIGFFTIAGTGSAGAFWETPQLIEEMPEARNIQVDVTCRVNDNHVPEELAHFRKPGVDGWLSFTAENSQEQSRIYVKNYQFNNMYPRYEGWSIAYELSGYNGYDCWGQSIKGFYHRGPVDVSKGTPAAYIAYIVDQNASGQNQIALSIITIASINEYDEIYCEPFIPEGTLDANSRTKLLMAGNNLILLWDEVNPQNGKRTIMMTHFQVTITEADNDGGEVEYVYEKGPNVIVASGITAPQGLDFRSIVYEKTESTDYWSAVCWLAKNQSGSDEIQGAGFRFHKPDTTFLFSNLTSTATFSSCPIGYTLSHPRMVVSTSSSTENPPPVLTVSWLSRPVLDPPQIQIRNAKFCFLTDLPDSLELSATTQTFPLSQGSQLYGIAADQGFMQPQSLAFDSANNLLGVAQTSNHRINILEDPFPSTSGAWIAELYNYRAENTGSLTRIADTDLKVRQIACLAVPEINGGLSSVIYRGYSFPNHLNDELFPVRTEEMAGSFMDPILEIEMVSDNFSSIFCFILTEDNVTNTIRIYWVCDGLLLKSDGNRDRLTHPYDLDFVPPVWTPTPTPTGSNNLTPLPTWTPCPDGLWVADMAGHRIVRLNMRGEIMASTQTENMPVGTPLWSEYELFDVISPNDVSAAYDGSCWAIDWGRNRVVKVAANGALVAVTEPCESMDPDLCFTQLKMIHPLAIDCAGDPNSCFVADYEGNRIYKLTLSENTLLAEASLAPYYRPKAVTVSRQYEFGQLRENVWVADRWSYIPTPSQNWTFTPVPTATPTPGPGTPTAVPYTPTPFPELQRVSLVEFNLSDPSREITCTIPISMSVVSDGSNLTHCYIADRDAGWSGMGKNFVRWYVIGDTVSELRIGKDDNRQITRPVDVKAVGFAPTWTPTATPTPTP